MIVAESPELEIKREKQDPSKRFSVSGCGGWYGGEAKMCGGECRFSSLGGELEMRRIGKVDWKVFTHRLGLEVLGGVSVARNQGPGA